jgi:hypothetical protein
MMMQWTSWGDDTPDAFTAAAGAGDLVALQKLWLPAGAYTRPLFGST